MSGTAQAGTAALRSIADGLRLLLQELDATLAFQANGAPEAAPAKPVLPPKYSDARKSVLREHWPAGTLTEDILAMLNALPGPKFAFVDVAEAAGYLKLRRPPGHRARVSALAWNRKHAAAESEPPKPKAEPGPKHSAERAELVRREWPKGTPVKVVLAGVNALPGAAFDKLRLAVYANQLGVRRPPGFNGTRKAQAAPPREAPPAAEPAPLPVPERPAPAPEKSVAVPKPVPPPPVAPPAKTVPAIKPPAPKIAAPPRLEAAPAPLPPIPTAAQLRRAAEAEAVKRHIARKGVTLCPPACAAVTTHVPTAEEAAAIRKITDEREAKHRAQILDHAQRVARNRLARLTGKPQEKRPHA